MKQYDAIIIGFGKAGKTLAAELSNRGWQVAEAGEYVQTGHRPKEPPHFLS